jgi:hypothetical protein
MSSTTKQDIVDELIDDILVLVENGLSVNDILIALKRLDYDRRRMREYMMKRYKPTGKPIGRPKKVTQPAPAT